MRPFFELLLLSTLFLSGCGSGLVDVTGTVTLDGQPLKQGKVVFRSPAEAMAVGEIQPDGGYRLKTGTQWGIKPGEYEVTVSAYKTQAAEEADGDPMFELLTPAKYNLPETSGLSANVQRGGERFDFNLESN